MTSFQRAQHVALSCASRKAGAAELAHPIGPVGVGGQAAQGLDQAVDVAQADGQAAAGLADRVGRLAVLRADEQRGSARGHRAVELAGDDDARSSPDASRSGGRRPARATRAAARAGSSRAAGCCPALRVSCAARTSASRGPSPTKRKTMSARSRSRRAASRNSSNAVRQAEVARVHRDELVRQPESAAQRVPVAGQRVDLVATAPDRDRDQAVARGPAWPRSGRPCRGRARPPCRPGGRRSRSAGPAPATTGFRGDIRPRARLASGCRSMLQ